MATYVEVRAQAARAGCRVSSFSLAIYRPVHFAQEVAAVRAAGVRLMSDALRACRHAGGEAVLLPHFDRQRLDIDPAEEERYVKCLRDCAPVAEDSGVTIALETTFSAAQLTRIVDAVGSPQVGVYQDLANAVIYRQDPAATLRALGHRVVMLHVKGHRRRRRQRGAGRGRRRLGRLPASGSGHRLRRLVRAGDSRRRRSAG